MFKWFARSRFGTVGVEGTLRFTGRFLLLRPGVRVLLVRLAALLDETMLSSGLATLDVLL